MCLSSLPGLIRALSKMSALFVEARTMTWSDVPIPEEERGGSSSRLINTNDSEAASRTRKALLTIHLNKQLV